MKKLLLSAFALVLFFAACDKVDSDTDTTVVPDTTTTETAYTAVAGEDNVLDLQSLFTSNKSGVVFQVNTTSENGSLDIVNNRYVKYTPNVDVTHAEDRIEIRNSDGGSKVVNISIRGGGDQLGDQKCGARADKFNVIINSTDNAFDVLKNDKICKVPNPASLVISAPAKNGVTTIAAGIIKYTPNKDFGGKDYLVYEVSSKDSVPVKYFAYVDINVVKKADPPTGGGGTGTCVSVLNPDGATVKFAATPVAIVLEVLKNDKLCDDYKGQPVTIAKAPKNGKAIVNATNTISYTPNAAFKGTDTLTYQVCNAAGKCLTATVKITTVDAGNPGGGGTPTCVPLLFPDKAEAKAETAVTIDVLKNDKVCTLTGLAIAKTPTLGTVKIVNNKLEYTPNKGVTKKDDTFVYQLKDATGLAFVATVVVSIK